MPITYIYQDVVQLTDGNWNQDPFAMPTSPYIETSQTVDVPFLSDSVTWTKTLDLKVIGDFNADGEVLEVFISDGSMDSTSVLFDPDLSNDGAFTGNTGPTNGVDNPLIGAWPFQGDVKINGHNGGSATDPFTVQDIEDILNDIAVFEGPRVDLSADLSDFGESLMIEYNITEYPNSENGVDFAEIAMDLTASGDWYGRHAISNVVFYLSCGEDVFKLKVDEWSDLNFEFKSTESLNFSAEVVEALADSCGLEDCDFIGMTIKAGNNKETDLGVKSKGEGEIIFGDIEDEYGAYNKIDCVVYADQVVEDVFLL